MHVSQMMLLRRMREQCARSDDTLIHQLGLRMHPCDEAIDLKVTVPHEFKLRPPFIQRFICCNALATSVTSSGPL